MISIFLALISTFAFAGQQALHSEALVSDHSPTYNYTYQAQVIAGQHDNGSALGAKI
jgi:hypothetical protein